VPPNTDAGGFRVIEDVHMPSTWMIIVGSVGALNAWLASPGVAAFLGFGKWSGR